MAKPTGNRKATPMRPSGMVSTFPDFYATKAIQGTFAVPGHGKIKLDLQPGDRMPGEIQSYPVINLLKLDKVVEDANARTGERNVRWKPRARPQGHPAAAVPDTELPRGIIIPESVSKALDAAGLNTPEAALAASDKELLAIKGIGKKTLADIRTLAEQMIATSPAEDITTEVPGPGDEPGDGDSDDGVQNDDPGTPETEGF